MAKMDPRKLKPAELHRLVNSTPMGEVISSSAFYRLRQRAGMNASADGRTMHLLKFTRWLVDHVESSPRKPTSAADKPGQSHRDRMAAASRARTESVSDIGELPPVADPKRREFTKHDLAKFCLTYNPKAFYRGWADYHKRDIARIEEAVFDGLQFAFAEPRGGGKSTLCRIAVLWAMSHGHSRYSFYIGATGPKGKAGLHDIKMFMRFLPIYADDFPEIAVPIQALRGRPQRAQSQHCNGEPTLIEWGTDQVVLPTVPVPEGLDAEGPWAPSSGAIIATSGLTAEGIRGSLRTMRTGEHIRPDFVVLDDPQTDESARNEEQNRKRLDLIHGAVLGMKGPGEKMAAVMPCTVIEPDDMVDQTLDRKKHPRWRGSRSSILDGWPPKNMDAIDKYFEVYDRCMLLEPPDFTESNEYYREHQKTIEAGLTATWDERKEAGELSAIQSALHLYHADPDVFMKEYMNMPVSRDADEHPIELDADDLAARRNGQARGQVPLSCERVAAYIDVQGELLYWLAVAWDDDFGGSVVDYGEWPKQKRSNYSLGDVGKALSMKYKGKDLGGRLYDGLSDLTEILMNRNFRRDDGADLQIERCLIDANWGQSTDVVYQFCRQSEHSSRLTPSHGKYYGCKGRGFYDFKKQQGERVGLHWRMPNVRGRRACRYVVIDTNFWKSFVAERLLLAEGSKGAIQFYGDRGRANMFMHRNMVSHLTAEQCTRVTANNRTVDEWDLPVKGRDNHWWDCLVGCAVAASMLGLSTKEHSKPKNRRRKRKVVSAPGAHR